MLLLAHVGSRRVSACRFCSSAIFPFAHRADLSILTLRIYHCTSCVPGQADVSSFPTIKLKEEDSCCLPVSPHATNKCGGIKKVVKTQHQCVFWIHLLAAHLENRTDAKTVAADHEPVRSAGQPDWLTWALEKKMKSRQRFCLFVCVPSWIWRKLERVPAAWEKYERISWLNTQKCCSGFI